MIVQPFPSFFSLVLWLLLTSCSSLLLRFFPSARHPRVSTTTFTSYICCVYALKFGQYWTLFCSGNSSVSSTPCIQFLFVRPRLCPQRHFSVSTSDFLQIPPHGGHPCLWLTVPTAKSVADLHRQVVTHAERTIKKAVRTDLVFTAFLIFYWLNIKI